MGHGQGIQQNHKPAHVWRALQRIKVYETIKKIRGAEFPSQFNFRMIEITPDRRAFGAVRDEGLKVTWQRKG